jgi:VanZ family protein
MPRISLRTLNMLVYKLLNQLARTPLWIRIVLAIAWYAFIWLLTDWPQSTPENTLQIIQQSGGPEEANFVFRTSSHFFVFGVQAILLLFVLAPTFVKDKKRIAIVLLATICLGAIDEVHQSFVPGRQPRALDVFKDGIGAIIFLWLLFWVKSEMKKRFSPAIKKG